MQSRALVVDDVATNRRMLRRILSQDGILVHEAGGYVEAIEALASKSFDLVLLDLALGIHGSGQEVLDHIRKTSHEAAPAVIVVTGSARDAASEADLLGLGARDFVARPFDIEVLRARISAALRDHARRTMLADRVRMVEESSRLDREALAAAAAVQSSSVPPFPLVAAGLQMTGAVVPSHHMSGDVIDVVEDRDGGVSVFLLDVAGHGAAAALVSAAGRTVLRRSLLARDDLEVTCASLSEELSAQGSPLQASACLSLVRFSPLGRTAEVINAGMPPVARISQVDGVRLFSSSAGPMGLGLRRPHIETIPVDPGDVFVVASDGLVSSMSGEEVREIVSFLSLGQDPRFLPHLGPNDLERLMELHVSRESTFSDDASIVIVGKQHARRVTPH